MRILIGLCLAIVLVAATPSESSAQAVAALNALEVAPAQMPTFLAAFARIVPIAESLGEGGVTLWRNVAGGGPHQVVVVVRFPSMEAWAAGQTATAASAEFQQALAAVGAAGATLISTVLQSEVAPPQ